MCGYCWGHSYVEGSGRPLPNSAYVTWTVPNTNYTAAEGNPER